MNSSSNIKTLIEEFIVTNSEDTLIKDLNKMLINLSGAERIKKDVFLNLSDKGINRLLSLLKHPTEEIRKKSYKALVWLLNGSEILQNIFCEKYNFNPIGNVIVINWWPEALKKLITINEHILYDIKKTQNVDPSNIKIYWQWPNNPKYNNEEYPDPKKYLLGIYTTNRNNMNFPNKQFDDDFDINKLVTDLENETV